MTESVEQCRLVWNGIRTFSSIQSTDQVTETRTYFNEAKDKYEICWVNASDPTKRGTFLVMAADLVADQPILAYEMLIQGWRKMIEALGVGPRGMIGY